MGGADEETYDRYAAAVREEYAWVPGELYLAGRRHVLTTFLCRPSIFATPSMRSSAEDAARRNLARELAALA